MDFSDTPEEAAFRSEVRAWLEVNAPRPSADVVPMRRLYSDPSPEADATNVRRCKEWQAALYRGGWAGITWPKEYGGRGETSLQQAIFNQEQADFDVSTGIFAVGIGMVGPTLVAHGNEAQKSRHLDALLRGTEVWCQLFSEPGAGSDLAGIGTRAERDGDEWIINGQKVWTSGAHHSEFGILLARTDPEQPKHRGITCFILDMSTPGIDVRPLRQINRVAHFNEVFLDNVRIPAENVIGEVNQGWRVAHTTLANERNLIGGSAGQGFAEILQLARSMGRTHDPLSRQALVDAYIRLELLRLLGLRARTALSQGRPPGPESSVLKLAYSSHLAATGDLVLGLEGASGMLSDDDAPDAGLWQQQFLGQWSSRFGGGTDQIQRNVLGERVLGLPGEPRVDKDIPYRQIAGSSRPS